MEVGHSGRGSDPVLFHVGEVLIPATGVARPRDRSTVDWIVADRRQIRKHVESALAQVYKYLLFRLNVSKNKHHLSRIVRKWYLWPVFDP